MTKDDMDIVLALLAALADKVGKDRFEMWFGPRTRIDWDDQVWYAVMPVLGYLCEAASGVALITRWHLACDALAASLGLLLIIGLHNAWDITLWSITRPRD